MPRAKKQAPSALSQAFGHALHRAAKFAHKTARMYGTPIYVWENGKVVAKNPDPVVLSFCGSSS
jgi:murein DD-endopeptidase MepM/ murein hydrolase activator NlpD